MLVASNSTIRPADINLSDLPVWAYRLKKEQLLKTIFELNKEYINKNV